MMKQVKKAVQLLVLLMLATALATGCSKANQSPVVIEMDDVDMRLNEVMVYLLQAVSEFERLGGEDIWDVEDFSGGKTAEEVAKERAIENIIKSKLIASKGEELGIEPDNEMLQEIESKAADYFNNLKPGFVADYSITEETVRQVFEDNAVSSLIMEKLTDNTEINEEDILAILQENPDYVNYKTKSPESLLTRLTIKQVIIRTHEQEAFDKITEAKKKLDEGVSMDDVIMAYSEDERLEETKGVYTVSLGLMTENQADAIKSLRTGGYTDIITGEKGYYIIQLLEKVTPTESEVQAYIAEFEQWELELRDNAVERLKTEAFNAFYEQWRSETAIRINREAWDPISYEDLK